MAVDAAGRWKFSDEAMRQLKLVRSLFVYFALSDCGSGVRSCPGSPSELSWSAAYHSRGRGKLAILLLMMLILLCCLSAQNYYLKLDDFALHVPDLPPELLQV